MKLKRFALRGLFGVAAAVALCMFFSGTIENITTPKVKIVRPSRGKFTQKLELQAALAYPDTEELRVDLPAGLTLTIAKANVRAGDPVAEGDVLFEAAVTGYEAARRSAQADYDAALDELMEIERKNEGLALRRSEQTYADSYAALRAAARETAARRTDMDVLLRAAKLSCPEAGYPEGAGNELRAAIDAYRAALAAQQQAQQSFDRAARYGVSDAAWAYISARQAAQEKLDACAEKLVELEELRRGAAAIRAPHGGVIARADLKAGDSYDGAAPLCAITAEGSFPALRASVEEVDRYLAEGTKVRLPSGAEAEITSTGFDDAGARCVDVALSDELLRGEGGAYKLSQSGAKLTILFTAAESTCLLPASAVRGSGNSRFVYVVNERTTTFGQKKLSLSRMDVTVLAEADGTASVEEDLTFFDVAYLEDRALTEGSDVMRYAQ